jgi:S1-C subfamily serine protease
VRDDENRREWERGLSEARHREQALNSRLQEAATGEVVALRTELKATRERLSTLEGEREAAERVIREYGAGVCLIQGSYGFFDANGRPLRYVLDDNGKTAKEDDGSLALAVEGKGDLHTVDYFGTGFLVDSSGLVLTNRHVGEPWSDDAVAGALAEKGYPARFTRFRAFFPREKLPFDLKFERSSPDHDLALLRVSLGKRKIPVLPLDRAGTGAVAGQPVVVVGYPTGIEAILAKTDGQVVRQILETHGTNPERVAEALAQRALVRPSSTQGHIGDITKTDLVFDAPTTQGGSGGPVFNKAGLVVAVEYAVLPKFGGNAFGVPIRYAIVLMRGKKRL